LHSMHVGGLRTEAVCPQAMLWQAVREGGAFATLLRDALRNRMPSMEDPWRLALYADEVTPGNVVSPDNKRKAWAAYWAILDIAPQALHDENAWFVLGIKRSSEVSLLPGGFSEYFAALVELFFTGGAHDASTVGFVVEFLDGHEARIWLRLDQIVQDDAAHKTLWGCVGAAGSCFCMLCLNCWADKAQAADGGDGAVMMRRVMVMTSYARRQRVLR
jgi:hypothetical protein